MFPGYVETIIRKSKKEEEPNKRREKSEITNTDSKLTIEPINKQEMFVPEINHTGLSFLKQSKNTQYTPATKTTTTVMKILILLTVLSLYSCTKPNEPTGNLLSLTVEDVSCIEAWLNVKTNGVNLPANVILEKNGNSIRAITLTTNDTTLYIDSLLPKQTYRFKLTGANLLMKSNEAIATTLDTTSHNFTWQSWTFGQSRSSSLLYDVAIIAENNIWAVGEIYMNDSLGNPNPTFYNAVHWDGQRWNLKKIYYKGVIWTIRCVFALNENDIWFSGYIRYDGTKFIELPIPSILMGWQINKMWGSSSNDLYVVGDGGNIAHYDGSSWTKIESGTSMRFLDISGKEKSNILYAIASEFPHDVNNYFVVINQEKKVKEIKLNNILYSKITVWSCGEKNVYLGGAGLSRSIDGCKIWKEERGISNLYINKVRGLLSNDIIICGHFGLLAHWNGNNWKEYLDEPVKNSDIIYFSVDYKKNIVVSTGLIEQDGLKAYILIGKK